MIASVVPPAASVAAQEVPSTPTNAPTPWSVETTPDGWQVTYRDDDPLTIGGAAYTVRHDGEILAQARENGTTAEAQLNTPPPPVDQLELWRGDSRVDSGAPSEPTPRSQQPAPDTATPAKADPGVAGPYATSRREYSLDELPWAEFPAPIEVAGELTVPTGAPGARPVVVILHGRHAACFHGGPDGDVVNEWPCPEGWQPIASHLGYRRIADLLASQGNVVASISANAVNGQDWDSPDGGAAARSALVRHHLGLFASWSEVGGDPWGGDLRGRLDLAHVALIGHSRGGEGVTRATIDSRSEDPWRIRGIVAIGPTAFGAQVPASVHLAVLLPYCDGDVSDLQGQVYVDGARDLQVGPDRSLRSAVMVYGANHNYFNAEWTPGLAAAPASDDWFADGSRGRCSPSSPYRLKPEAQQQVGATYSAALVKLALDGDARMLELLDSPASGPASTGNAMVRTTAIGGARTPLWSAAADRTPRGQGVVARFCSGEEPRTLPRCNPGVPHWPSADSDSAPPAISAHQLTWDLVAVTRFPLLGPTDVSSARRIEVRVAAAVESAPVQAVVMIVDDRGRRVVLPGVPQWLTTGPGQPEALKSWARAVRGSLRGVSGIDLHRIVAVEMLTVGGGSGYAFDVTAVSDQVPTVEPVFLPVLDLTTVEANEGDDLEQQRTTMIEAHVRGTVTTPLRYSIATPGEGDTTAWTDITIAPGVTSVEVPIRWSDNLDPGGDRLITASAYARRGGLSGAYQGGVRVIEDDPAPTITIATPLVAGTEESGVTIRLVSDVAPKVDYKVWGLFTAPDEADIEIDALDVSDATWAEWNGGQRLAGTHPSDAAALVGMVIPAGQTEATLTIPFEQDGIDEGAEAFRIEFALGGSDGAVLDATVTD